MLVLTRKKNQSIMIGEKIKITVLEICGDSIKIGIDAPPELIVLRSELYQEVEQENNRAVKVNQLNLEQLRNIENKKQKKGVIIWE